MHETIIANNLIMEANKHGKVREIFLEIGQLAHVPENELLECLRSLVRWKIHAKEKPAKVKCSCGFSGSPKILEREHDFILIECPKCEGVPELVDGNEIKLLKVVVD